MEKTVVCYYFSCVYASILLLIASQMSSSSSCLAKRNTSLASDALALVTLKAHITSDPYETLTTNWSDTSSVCSWIGVSCGSRHRRVTALNMSGMGLSGTIPPHLGNLSFLVSLDLYLNLFHGTLPRELSRLGRLKLISVDGNSFDGEIPSWLSLLPQLEHISLRKNYFTGLIPKSLSNISSLQYLDFTNNSLHGEIPQELGRLESLQVFSIQGNRLSGVIPSAIFNMSALIVMAFTGNELSGSLPADDHLCRNLPLLQELYLGDNKLSGLIPSNLSHCQRLRNLMLFDNSLTGSLPHDLCGKSLQVISLDNNQLRGQIRSNFSHCQHLRGLSLSFNFFSGLLPSELCAKPSPLQVVVFHYNQFTGQIPSNLSGCSQLRTLDLRSNNLNGDIPRQISQLEQLEDLDLIDNGLSGRIPEEVFNISSLGRLGLNRNVLSGGLPSNMCDKLVVFEGLYLGGNSLSGSIPDSISNCSNLRIISVSFNKFTGFIPHALGKLRLLEELFLSYNYLRSEPSSSELSFLTSLTNCTSLSALVIGGNPLGGFIPASIGNLSSALQILAIDACNIRGIIPGGIGNLRNLVTLVLADNDLYGKIPPTVSRLHKLQGINFRNNNMTGPIVEGFCELPSLVQISLQGNQFSGSVPECLGNVTSFRDINLRSNRLSSSIPSSLWRLKDLLRLDLSSNSLTGFLPPEIGNLEATIYINLSRNQLSDSIPTTIGNLQNLINLSLAYNKLSGPLPESLGSMFGLVTLDLSNNGLSGSIPKSLEKLQYLHYFDVSFNALSGEIPTGGPFMNFTMESFMGNKALCGILRFNVPLCHTGHKSNRKKVVLTMLFILGGIVASITLVCLAFMLVRYQRKKKTATGVMLGELVSTAPERISYYEILQATQQLNECNLLGVGSFGRVYKAVLRDGVVVAVKVFNLQLEAAFKSFDVECEVLRNLRHRNLTKVVSSCSNEEYKALVLEYMPNGSLEKWLYSHNYCLDLMQRLKIMIDVASGLEYLHHGYSTPIAHCDLKPSNVLLDEEMTGRVSDFGIAKLLGDGESIVVTNTLATLGYIAPEYGLEGLVSTRCDVYSYGVMLMETFTRRKPSDDMFGGDLSLKKWVESLVPHSPHDVVDSNLVMNLEGKQLEKKVQCVSLILELALKCCAESPRDRIDMVETVAELNKIKLRFSSQ